MTAKKPMESSTCGRIKLVADNIAICDKRTRIKIDISHAQAGADVEVTLCLANSEGVTMQPSVKRVRVLIVAGNTGTRNVPVIFRGSGPCTLAAHATNIASDYHSMEVVS